ncbi:MAG: hypothetical protein H6843_16420 [Rhodospirillaceae bacterium]|nr:hypothetical protein [Rhodospirillaceae bacterium]
MAGFSVLTNPQAAAAVLNLNKTLSSLNETQNRINTGLKVATAKDDAATFAIALGMRSDVAAYKQVRENLSLGQSTLGTASAAVSQIGEEISAIKEKVTQAANLETGRDEVQLAIDNALNNIRNYISAASFNGVNLIDGSEDKIGQTFDVVSSLTRTDSGVLSLSKIKVNYEDLSVDNSGRGLSALSGVDVTEGKATEASVTRTDAVSADLKFATGGLTDGEQFDLNYVDADGNDQSLTFTTYSAVAGQTGTNAAVAATAGSADTNDKAAVAVTFSDELEALLDDGGADADANEIGAGLTRVAFTLTVEGEAFDASIDVSAATDSLSMLAILNDSEFFTTHQLTATGDGDSLTITQDNATDDVVTFTNVVVEGSAATTAQLASDFAIVGGSAQAAADSLKEKLDNLALDGGPLAGLGFTFDSTTTSGTLTVARSLAEGVGEIKAFTTGTVNTFTTASDTFTLNESDGKTSQVALTFNKDLEAGDVIELTFNNGVNDKTFTLVIGEKSDTTTTSGAEITGSNGKYHLAYDEVVANGGVARTTDEVASAVYAVLSQAGSATSTNAGALVGAINDFLNSGTGTAATTDTLGGNSDAAFKLQLNGDTITITDTDQRASGADDAFSISAFNMDSSTGGSLDFDAMLKAIDAAETTLKQVSARIGAAESSLESQADFMDELTKAVNDGIGTLVDANMAEESARLQALQVQQQLGLQALSIANQQPQSILGLFQ